MNVLHIYSIHDAAVAAFATPFVAATDVAASRVFSGVVNEPGSVYSIQPSDFTLFRVGTFDVMSGRITVDEIKRIRNGLELVKQVEAFNGGQGNLAFDEGTGDLING